MNGFLRHTWDLLLRGAGLISGLLAGMAAGNNPAILLLLALMVADYLSGLAAAVCRRSNKTERGGLSSRAGMLGLLRKALMLLVVLIGYALDRYIGDGHAMFQTAVTWFYVSNEGLSLLENLSACGVPIPGKLRDSLEELGRERQSARGKIGAGGEAAGSADTADESVPDGASGISPSA